MIDLSEALDELVQDCAAILAAAGVTDPVVTDPAAVTPPCVYVHLSSLSGLRLAGYDLTGLIDVVAPNLAADAAMTHLSRMAGPLIDELPLNGPADFVQLATPGAGDPYPTLRITALVRQA